MRDSNCDSAFPCPFCHGHPVRVLDSRLTSDNHVRRRRACMKCGKRLTTYEIPSWEMPPKGWAQATRKLLERAIDSLPASYETNLLLPAEKVTFNPTWGGPCTCDTPGHDEKCASKRGLTSRNPEVSS